MEFSIESLQRQEIEHHLLCIGLMYEFMSKLTIQHREDFKAGKTTPVVEFLNYHQRAIRLTGRLGYDYGYWEKKYASPESWG